MKPLYCEEFLGIANKICYQSLSDKATIKIRTPHLHFQIHDIFLLESLIIDAIDSHFPDDLDPCLSRSSFFCCDLDALRNFSHLCSLRNWSLGKKGDMIFTNAHPLFSLKNKFIGFPNLFLYNIEFNNFQTKWIDYGYDGLIKFDSKCLFGMNMLNVVIFNSYFWNGIMSPLTEEPSLCIGTYYRILFSNFEVNQYNQYGIFDQEFDKTPSVFSLYDIDVSFVLKSVRFININLVKHKVQEELLMNFRISFMGSNLDIQNMTFINISTKGSLILLEKTDITFSFMSFLNCSFTKEPFIAYFGLRVIGLDLRIANTFVNSSLPFLRLIDSNILKIDKLTITNSGLCFLNMRKSSAFLGRLSASLNTIPNNFLNIENSTLFLLSACFKLLVGPKTLLDTSSLNNINIHNITISEITLITLIRSLDLSGFSITSMNLTNLTETPSFLGLGDIFKIFFIANSNISDCKFYIMFGVFLGNPPTLKYFYLYNSYINNVTVTGGWFWGMYLVFIRVSNSYLANIYQHHNNVIMNMISVVLYSLLIMINTTIKDLGYTKEPERLDFIADYTIIFGYQSTLIQIDNCQFLIGNTTSAVSGFLSLSLVEKDVIISNCRFIAYNKNPNYSYMGILVQGALNVYFMNNTISDLECPVNKKMFISTYHRNGVVSFRAFGLEQSLNSPRKAIVVGNKFQSCKCQQGGSLFIENYRSLMFQLNTFNDSKAFISRGGHLMILGATNINMNMNSFYNSSAATQGGSVFIESVDLILINNTKFNYSYSANEGGCIYLKVVAKMILINSHIENSISSETGGAIFLESSAIEIYSITITKSTSITSGGCLAVTQSSSLRSDGLYVTGASAKQYGAFILAESPVQIYLVNVVISGCEALVGGIVYLAEVFDLYIDNLTINSSKTKSGIIVWDAQTTDGNLAKYYVNKIYCHNNNAFIGSCLFLRVSYDLVIINSVSIKNCTAGKAIYVYIQKNIKLAFNKLILESSFSDSSLIYFKGINVSISDVLIIKNNVTISVFEVQSVESFEIFNTLFMENIKKTSDSVVFQCENSYLLIKNFSDLNRSSATKETIPLNINTISLIHSIVCTVYLVEIDQNHFKDYKSLIYIESGELNAKNSSFYSINSLVFSAFHSSLSIENCVFYRIGDFKNIITLSDISEATLLTAEGDDVGVLNFKNNILNYIQGLALQINSLSKIWISLSNFTSDTINTTAVRIINCHTIIVTASKFTNFSNNNNGGCIKIISEDFWDNGEIPNITISSNIFENSKAPQGGAIYFSIATDVSILIHKNTFRSNDAWIGGAIFLVSDISIANNLLASKNEFIDNKASFHSPTIYSQIAFKNEGNIFRNNSDRLAISEKFMGLPIRLNFFQTEKNEYIRLMMYKSDAEKEEFFNRSLIEPSDEEFSKTENFIGFLKSGQANNFSFSLTDDSGQLLVFEDGSSVSFEPLLIRNINFNDKITFENSLALSQGGMVNFDRLIIRGRVNTFYVIQMKIKISNEKNYASRRSIELVVYLKIKILFCSLGQILSSDFSCNTCPQGYFTTVDPLSEIHPGENSCRLCPGDGECPGGFSVFPKAGFWRFGNLSTRLVSCFKDEACIGPQVDR
jgi:hypothetical protein